MTKKNEDSKRKESDGKAWPDHYNPKPGELDAVWPTVVTSTYVRMVFGVIKQGGQCTQEQIVEKAHLPADKVGVALAELMLWEPKKVGQAVRDLDGGEQRVYFAVEA